MKKQSSDQTYTCTVNSRLYVFNDVLRAPTEDDINRPRYGRPKHSPSLPPPPKKNNRKKKS